MLTSNHMFCYIASPCYHVHSCKQAYVHTYTVSGIFIPCAIAIYVAFPQSPNNSIAFSVSDKALGKWLLKHKCPYTYTWERLF